MENALAANQGNSQTPDKDKISLLNKVIYGLGAFVNNILAAAMGGMVVVLNLGLGMNPALVGLVSALPRFTDAITDPLMGYISDHTKSKWGAEDLISFSVLLPLVDYSCCCGNYLEVKMSHSIFGFS